MWKIVNCIILLFVSTVLVAQEGNDPVLLKIDDKPITKSEFEAVFKKNNRDSIITVDDLDDYVELFINFKLKVNEAEELGMDTLPSFIRELKGYRDQLAKPYLADKVMTDSLIIEAYNRLQSEVRASHILLTLPADPTPEDTLAVYREIMKIKTDLLKDASEFEKVAKAKSQDPSAAKNSGDLGYFTALQMVYPFENAVFNTPVGEIGGPVRTQYGYHLVKITDKRPARGEVRVAHIMIRTEEGDPEDVKQRMKQRAEDIHQRILAGEDFEVLAKKFSDDRSSSGRGGELSPFGPGKMVSEFEEAAFALKEVGQISEPIKSPYGWHIIKLLETIPLKSFEEMQKDLEVRVARDSRSHVSRESFIEKRKQEYHFQEDRRQLRPFYTQIDTSYFSGKWAPSDALKNSKKALFTLDGKDFTQADFASYLEQRMRSRRMPEPIKQLVDSNYDKWVEMKVMEYEDSRLEEKYPAFKTLITEYRDGILLFDLTDQKVWSKAVSDSAGLAEFYEANKEKFMWNPRADYEIYTVENAKEGKRVQKMLKRGKKQDEIRQKVKRKDALEIKVESGLKQKEDLPIFELVKWEKGVSDVVNDDGQLKVIHIKRIRPAAPKEFSEARGTITAAYQNALEAEWVEALRQKHKIEVNREVLHSIQ